MYYAEIYWANGWFGTKDIEAESFMYAMEELLRRLQVDRDDSESYVTEVTLKEA